MTQTVSNKSPRIFLPKLRPDQYEIAIDPAKMKVVCCGRRFGKTIMAFVIAFLCAHQGGRVAWVAPFYSNSEEFWLTARPLIAPLEAIGLIKINQQQKIIRFLYSHGYIRVYSMDKDKGIRGKGFNLMIIDEAAAIPDNAWRQVLSPCLADMDGDVIAISTPLPGRNWFREYFDMGQDPANWKEIRSWKRPSWMNPMPTIQAYVEKQKRIMPERDFNQEYGAEFLAEGGNVFMNIDSVTEGDWDKEPNPLSPVVIGIDFATRRDVAVFCVMRVRTKEQVALHAFERTNYIELKEFTLGLVKRWQPITVIAETNRDESILQFLAQEGVPIQGFFTTNALKAQIISELKTSLALMDIRLLVNPEQRRQLECFECKQNSHGNIVYKAPSNDHDDYVMALALAHHLCYQAKSSFASPLLYAPRVAVTQSPLAGFLVLGDTQAAIALASSDYRGTIIHEIALLTLSPNLIVDKLLDSGISYAGIYNRDRDFIANCWRDAVRERLHGKGGRQVRLIERDKPREQGQRLGCIQSELSLSRLHLARGISSTDPLWKELTSDDSFILEAISGAIELVHRYGNEL